jgi:hypothetical protein
MKATKAKSIDEYISQFPGDIQQRLTQIRETINRTLPHVEETIRYGMPAFKLNKEHIYISSISECTRCMAWRPLKKNWLLTVGKTQRTRYIFRTRNRFHYHLL